MPARCDVCGRFVDGDALIISAFITPPREGMEDTIYCPRCAPDPAPAGGPPPAPSRAIGVDISAPAGAPKHEGTEQK